MQLEDKLGIAKSLENFEKIWTFPLMNYQKKVISLEECYPLYEQTIPNSLRKSLFPNSKF